MIFSSLSLIPADLFIVFSAVLGLFIGSFLNVCIMRGAAGASIVWPPSHCDGCGATLRPWELIPVLSWLALRGKCARCGAKIHICHPLTELLTGLVFALLAWRFGPSPRFAAYLVFSCIFIAESGIDFRIMELPDLLTVGGAVLALPCAILLGMPWLRSLLGGIIAAGLFFAVMVAFEKIRGIEGLGFGDVKLMLGLGFLCGLPKLPLVLMLSGILALLYMIPYAFLKGGDLRTMRTPFGPFLCLGAWLSLVFGDQIISWWLGVIL